MIYLLNILVLSVLTFLSLSVFPYIKIFGVVPLLVPFFLISVAYFRKGFEPILLSALFGIYFDFYSSYPFGFYLLLFLFSSILVKVMFQEGMRSLSLWYYFIFCGLFLVVYYGFQIAALQISKIAPSVLLWKPIVFGLIVNSVFVIILYVFSNWYFDYTVRLEDELKRR